MKKIFLFTCILTYSFACAQQNEFFDIQKHITIKIKEEQKQKKKEQTFSFLRAPRLAVQWYSAPEAKLSYTIPNGNKVYLLPQDNMLCIVPDMSHCNMPNISNPDEYFRSLVLGNQVPGKIPNAAIPYIIIPPTK